MSSSGKEVDRELPSFVRVYKDGVVERLGGSPIVPPSPEGLETGVSSKDISTSQDPPISARVYLPKLTDNNESHQKLPILVYFHGGGFCIESAFSFTETTLMNHLVSEAKAVAISIEYRLAPEHPPPVSYEDCWAALQWVASLSLDNDSITNKEPWLSDHGDFERLFVGGDSAGANIVHNVLMKAGNEALPGGVKILGAFLTHPYFWGSKPVGQEEADKSSDDDKEEKLPEAVWKFVHPSAPGGIDDPMINPVAPGAPSLAKLGCSRLLITVASEDVLRDRGICYYEAVKESGWKGNIELVEVEGEDHAFHILNHGTQSSKDLIKRLATFLQQQ